MNRRILIAAGLLLAMCYVAFGLSRIRFDVEITRLLPDDLKEAEGARLFFEHFARQGELIVTIEADDEYVADEAAESLASAFRAEQKLVASVLGKPVWEAGQGEADGPGEDVDDGNQEGGGEMLEFIAWALINRPAEELDSLEKSLGPGSVDRKLRDAMEQLSVGVSPEEMFASGYDPLGFLGKGLLDAADSVGDASEFSSQDGLFRALYVATAIPDGTYQQKIDWVDEMWDVVRRWEGERDKAGGDRVVIGFTGEPAFVAEISGGMEGDMRKSASFTLVMIGLIFWIAYRRFRPIFDLVGTLVVIFVLTLATGGILFRELSAISIGFASILIGLTVDYGLILYQEARGGTKSVGEVRGSAGRGILWASLTTAAAFGSLAAGNVPGLAELGILVGVGVLIGAGVMVGFFVYRAVAAGKREAGNVDGSRKGNEAPAANAEGGGYHGAGMASVVGAWATGAMLIVLLGVLTVAGPPELDSSPTALRPRDSKAEATMVQLADRLGDSEDLVSVIVTADNLSTTKERLQAAEQKLKVLEEAGDVKSHALPTAVWPETSVQKKNLEGPCARLVADRERLEEAILMAGFTDEAFAFAGAILDFWKLWKMEGRYPVWPEGDAARRAVSRFVAWEQPGSGGDGGAVWGLGLLRPAQIGNRDELHRIRAEMDIEGVYLSGGNVLSTALSDVVPGSIARIFAVLSALVFLALIFAFRSAREVVLTVASVVVTIGATLGAMKVCGVSWNFMNLAALLLALGAGLDYAIHILIDLRRHGGDILAVQKGVGRALLICGLSSVAGFGSLAWASNMGLASLGQACALALAVNTFAAVFLLPFVWRILGKGGAIGGDQPPTGATSD